MDVNGTRFHLIYGSPDWQRCRDESAPGDGYEVDGLGLVRLRSLTPLFARGRRSSPLTAEARRGAAADRFGNWYWIGANRDRLYWSPSGSRRARVYWPQPRPKPRRPAGAFAPRPRPLPPLRLSGLTVTTHHYLVVGSDNPAGLYIFDLHRGGEPLWLGWPEGVDFAPFDMVAGPQGELWVLDRDHRQLWGLDRTFRLRPLHTVGPTPAPAAEAGRFCPADEPCPPPVAPVGPIQGFDLTAVEPIAIELLDARQLLVMGAPAGPHAGSQLYHYRLVGDGLELAAPPLPLPDLSSVVAADAPTRAVVGHDMAYLAAADRRRLYVVERDGNQVIAYELALPPPGEAGALQLTPQALYLPLHYAGGRGLAAAVIEDSAPAVFYDVTGVAATATSRDDATRWVALQSIDRARHTRTATLDTPVFDSRRRGCTWHRLFLDACIPPETDVEVWTRAGDDRDLLELQPFQPEPSLYRRGAGAEIPYYNPYPASPGRSGRPPANDPSANHSGTWEVLLQAAQGRFAQARLVLRGNGRASPELKALRLYYPRLSYPLKYLPAVYQDEPVSANFLERMLANMEGFYSELEGKIAGAQALFDARSAPTEALAWLADWMGLVVDPLWSSVAETSVGGDDRRRLLIRFAMRLYARRGTPDGLRFALLLLLDPCLEDTLRRLLAAAIQPDAGLAQELAGLGLPYPSLSMTALELEEIFYHYVLAGRRPPRVRIVERWQTREGRAAAAGLATGTDDAPPLDRAAAVRASAHYFSVLVPEGIPADRAAMLERIIRLEKPAHTRFDVLRFWDYFRVGEARLGLDTELGEEGRFLPIILGRDYLSEGYVEAAHPMNVSERPVIDRDRL